MDKNFILSNNNEQKIDANAIVKFSLDIKDYLVYSIKENEQNSEVFVSKLILNSEGKYFIENIDSEEKSKLNNIVYNIVILYPTRNQKGENAKELLNELTSKYGINLSLDIPVLNEQEFYKNCSIARTAKEFIELAENFYNTNLKEEPKVEELAPTWNLPTENTNVITPIIETPVEEPKSEAIEMTPIEPVAVPSPVMEEVKEETIPTANDISGNMNIVTGPTQVASAEPTSTQVVEPTPIMPTQVEKTIAPTPVVENKEEEPVLPNPQQEKLAVIADPSLQSSGLNVETTKPNGFAVNKYIIIGTICLLLSIAVVVVAYILIQKKINGA